MWLMSPSIVGGKLWQFSGFNPVACLPLLSQIESISVGS